MEAVMPERPLFRISAESTAIERLLDTVEVGAITPYERLAAQAGLPTDSPKLGLAIRSATRRLRRQKAKAFGTIVRVGVKRLNDAEIVELAEHRVKRSGRATRVTQEFLALVDVEKATPEVRRRAMEVSTQNGLMALWTQPSVMKDLQKAIGDRKPSEVPAPRAFLSLFVAGDKK
jgi:hypothetical protein